VFRVLNRREYPIVRPKKSVNPAKMAMLTLVSYIRERKTGSRKVFFLPLIVFSFFLAKVFHPSRIVCYFI
jgi:hypothetical protein